MQHKMRRFKQLLPKEETHEILCTGSYGVLALTSPDGWPYSVPINYAFADGALWFHSAVTGHKLDAIGHDSRASMCVVAKDTVVPEEFTTYFKSVIVFGRISVVEDKKEMIKGLKTLCDKYCPGIDPASEIAGGLSRVKVLKMTIEEMTGKEAIELTRMRKQHATAGDIG